MKGWKGLVSQSSQVYAFLVSDEFSVVLDKRSFTRKPVSSESPIFFFFSQFNCQKQFFHFVSNISCRHPRPFVVRLSGRVRPLPLPMHLGRMRKLKYCDLFLHVPMIECRYLLYQNSVHRKIYNKEI